ncbi:ATP-binding cassette domain-containing protein, partial [Streptomyces sp. NPDC048506]|uniref:ATP-binding cassette domain-containing protein n=1 Tax=Streptomyces sp. NPDC048506 TaxID=3155028 RepID=UPI00343858CC
MTSDQEQTNDAERELFGRRLRMDEASARHEQVPLEIPFHRMAGRVPALLARSAAMAWAVDRLSLVTVAVAQVGRGAATAFGLLATNEVLVDLFAGGPTPDRVRAALPSLLVVAGTAVLVALLTAMSALAVGRLEPQVERAASLRLLSHAIRVELADLEDTQVRRLLETAEFGTDAARRLIGHAVAVINGLISLVAAAWALTVLHPLLLPLLLLTAMPKGYGTVRTARRVYRSIQRWLDHVRVRRRLSDLLLAPDPARELRAHAVGPLARERAIPAGGLPLTGRPTILELDDVSFTYRGQAAPAVTGVSLRIPRGSVVALVGDNGSGKSTLAKLIAGLYLPDSGRLTWDGTDIRELDRDTVFDRVALVDQDFLKWPFTARANVTLGRPERAHDEAALRRSAAFADVDGLIRTLPRGWNTLLERGFHGGQGLSGGQQQRFALARAHFRDASVVIVDEPTAALDAASEIEVFHRIRALADSGRTVVLITHRLASVRCADTIYVLDRGKVIEQGDHDGLLAAQGSFAAAYRLQAEQFRDGPEQPPYTGAGRTTSCRSPRPAGPVPPGRRQPGEAAAHPAGRAQ